MGEEKIAFIVNAFYDKADKMAHPYIMSRTKILSLENLLPQDLEDEAFGFLRIYVMGRAIRSAIRAANGIPAVSPPATESKASYPTLRITVTVRKSIRLLRMRGKLIIFRQSI